MEIKMDKIYKAVDRFTGEVVTGYAVVKKMMMGTEVAVLFTRYGERNCFSDSVKVVK